jgi:hypothetical protein
VNRRLTQPKETQTSILKLIQSETDLQIIQILKKTLEDIMASTKELAHGAVIKNSQQLDRTF